MVRRFLIASVSIIVLICAVLYIKALVTEPVDPPTPEGPITELETGLKKGDRERLRTIYQGTNLFPLAFLFALKDQATGKMACEVLADYGFLPAEKTAANPYGLPIGLGVGHADFLELVEVPVVGLNCAACHTGELVYKGNHYRIDGAPNLIDVERWATDTAANAEALKGSAIGALEFFARFIAFKHTHATDTMGAYLGLEEETIEQFARELEEAQAPVQKSTSLIPGNTTENAALLTSPEPGSLVAGLLEEHRKFTEEDAVVTKGLFGPPMSSGPSAPPADLTQKEQIRHSFRQVLAALVNDLDRSKKMVAAIKRSPQAGPGRDDAWGLVNLVVLDDHSSNLDAPIGIPHLFNKSKVSWIHADGNTNSVLDRNIAQGVALGAEVYEDGKTSLLPTAIKEMDDLLAKIHPPEWPEYFPKPEKEETEHGRVLFNEYPVKLNNGKVTTCADCHTDPKGKSIPIDVIGTSRVRWSIYNEPTPAGPNKLQKLVKAVDRIKRATMEARKIPESDYSQWEKPGEKPEWRSSVGYVAHELTGVWATAPFLHNNSVRTLDDLFKAEDKREKTFYVGSREFDPEAVGFVNKPTRLSYLLDTTVHPCDSNKGHNFTPNMTEGERKALIAYLKSLKPEKP